MKLRENPKLLLLNCLIPVELENRLLLNIQQIISFYSTECEKGVDCGIDISPRDIKSSMKKGIFYTFWIENKPHKLDDALIQNLLLIIESPIFEKEINVIKDKFQLKDEVEKQQLLDNFEYPAWFDYSECARNSIERQIIDLFRKFDLPIILFAPVYLYVLTGDKDNTLMEFIKTLCQPKIISYVRSYKGFVYMGMIITPTVSADAMLSHLKTNVRMNNFLDIRKARLKPNFNKYLTLLKKTKEPSLKHYDGKEISKNYEIAEEILGENYDAEETKSLNKVRQWKHRLEDRAKKRDILE